VELNKNEFILWERSANVKIKFIKQAGRLYITNKRIIFSPYIGKNFDIYLKDIENVEIVGRLFKRLKITARGKEYAFLTKGAKNLLLLIKNLMKRANNEK